MKLLVRVTKIKECPSKANAQPARFSPASSCLASKCWYFSNGEYVKAGLSELGNWCYKATKDVRLLVCTFGFGRAEPHNASLWILGTHQRPNKTVDEIIHDLCPKMLISTPVEASDSHMTKGACSGSKSCSRRTKRPAQQKQPTRRTESDVKTL
ncbi:IQ motif, EF-hand binding site [Artemisia annua]|uniref:IQ motif, EF-hand binding site n=1 Tax=Artemisia annua TaxID=35608 RepID=A0A2U1L738_ARTAN|nr:IQ motif, EF-hand binding site [Artemisia annua]